MEINRALGAELAEQVEAQPKECFRNSVIALFCYRGAGPIYYVEGVLAIMDKSLVIDHGWLEVAGQIVDVTLDDCAAEDYYPVIRHTRADIKGIVRGTTLLPLFMRSVEWRRQMGEATYRYYQTLQERGAKDDQRLERSENPGQ